MLLLTRGRFRLNLDFEEVAGTAPAMLPVLPGQVHQLPEMAEPQGWAVSFEPAPVGPELQRLLEQDGAEPLPPSPVPAGDSCTK